MAIDIDEAYSLLTFLKKLKHKEAVGTAEKMVGKFEGIIPEGVSSVDFLRQVREKQYD
ncbi:MAG TPA: hypothetical protein HA257_05405 [Candidatus Methanoperedenaceae archaeon]|nr:hypothetical protein [Candidatus Methanoperedenaceae archaeon]